MIATKCFHCKLYLADRIFNSRAIYSYICNNSFKVTYCCDGICAVMHSQKLSCWKDMHGFLSSEMQTIYRLRSPYHGTSFEFQLHLKNFHNSNSNYNASQHNINDNSNQDEHLPTSIHDKINEPFENMIDYSVNNNDMNSITNKSEGNNLNVQVNPNNLPCPILSSNPSMEKYVVNAVATGVKNGTKTLICKAIFQNVLHTSCIDAISMHIISIFF